MKAELKQQWIEALESGKYQQGCGVLYNARTDTYCCLGVLCDIARFDGWEQAKEKAKAQITPNVYFVNNFEFYSFVSLRTDNNNVGDGKHCVRLQYMNDLEAKDFKTIANYIKANIQED